MPNRNMPYPKLLFTKPKTVILSHHTASYWVERRKRKKVVIEEIIRLWLELDLMAPDLNVKEIKWHRSKNRHSFSTKI